MDWSERYATPLNDVFSRQHKLELEWRVELALLKALGEAGLAPKEAYEEAKAVIECACAASCHRTRGTGSPFSVRTQNHSTFAPCLPRCSRRRDAGAHTRDREGHAP